MYELFLSKHATLPVFSEVNSVQDLQQQVMALIYKHLLDILKVESLLNGKERWDQGGFEQLLPICSSFRKAMDDSDTSDADRLNIFPKALKCTSRLLSKLVSLVDSQVNHEKLTLVVMDNQTKLLLALGSDCEHRRKIREVLMDDQASVVMIFLHTLTVLEGVAQGTTADKSSSGPDNEPILEAALLLHNSLLTAVFAIDQKSDSEDALLSNTKEIPAAHKLTAAFEGALGSQAVLALLTLSKHRAKRVAASAVVGLLLSMRCFVEQRETWRACFPGTFSGLFLLTQSGFKR